MTETMKIHMVDLKSQYLKIKEEVDTGIAEVINSGAFINGKPVKDLAKNLEAYLGVKKVVPCANGTDALQIALMALGLKPGDEVITVAFTFVATVEVIALLGLKPVFVDIDPQTFSIDVNQLEKAITPKTKCILPVHLYGQASNMEAIMEVANKHNLFVVEDNAQAIGSDVTFSDGRRLKTGTIGHIGCTSFYPSKNLGCYGDGGALFSNDEVLGEQIRRIANHGQVVKYTYDRIGVNSRLDSMQAVVLNAKLKNLDTYNTNRRQAADWYDELLADHPRIEIPHRASYSTHVFHQYTIKVAGNRDEIRAKLKEVGVPTMVYYPRPLHLEVAYLEYGHQKGDLPVTEDLAQSVLSLPMHSELDRTQVEYIAQQVRAIV